MHKPKDIYEFHGGLGPISTALAEGYSKVNLPLKKRMIYHNRDTQDAPLKEYMTNVGLKTHFLQCHNYISQMCSLCLRLCFTA